MSRPSELGKLFGERLRELRLARRLTQQSLAERAGLPQTHVSAMERGIKLPNLVTLLRLASALECKTARLVNVFDDVDVQSILRVSR